MSSDAPQGRSFRISGLVITNSIRRSGTQVDFEVTDLSNTVSVRYVGTLPGLYKDGRGAVVEGSLQPDQLFVASQVLAKHDENYMPPEAADALRRARQSSGAPQVDRKADTNASSQSPISRFEQWENHEFER